MVVSALHIIHPPQASPGDEDLNCQRAVVKRICVRLYQDICQDKELESKVLPFEPPKEGLVIRVDELQRETKSSERRVIVEVP